QDRVYSRVRFNDATLLLRRLIDDKLIRSRAVVGYWPANRSGADDIKLQDPANPGQTLAVLHHLRQQQEKASGKPNFSLADFVAPEGIGVTDYVGGFVDRKSVVW